MMKLIKNEIPIYGGTWFIGFYEDSENKDIEKKYDLDDISWCNGIAFKNKGKYYTIFKKDKVTPGIIAHEILHVVNSIFIDIGHPPNRHNDEPDAYLLTWMVNRVHENIPKENKCVRNNNPANNRCITCGAKAGHPCELKM